MKILVGIRKIILRRSLWIFLGWIVGLFALLLTYRSIDLNRKVSASSFLIQMNTQFESEYRPIRKIFSEKLLNSKFKLTDELYNNISADKLYGFFELLGLMWKEKILSSQEIDVIFGEYLDGYYEIAVHYNLFKGADRNFLKNFRDLVEYFRKTDKSYGYSGNELQDFIMFEARMGTK